MQFDRRAAIVGLGAMVAAAALPSNKAEAFFIRVLGPRFTATSITAAAAEWVEVCAYRSAWHYDREFSEPGTAFIRHLETNLTYLVTPGDDGEVEAMQVSTENCPAAEDADPVYIVGHAARLVASRVAEVAGLRDASFYVDFDPEADERIYVFMLPGYERRPWPEPVIRPAPAIPIKPLRASEIGELV